MYERAATKKMNKYYNCLAAELVNRAMAKQRASDVLLIVITRKPDMPMDPMHGSTVSPTAFCTKECLGSKSIIVPAAELSVEELYAKKLAEKGKCLG